MKLKVGDKVMVMVGKDKGKTGTITHTFKAEDKIIIGGVNMVKKHVKPNNTNETGGIVETEGKIQASNVMILDKKTSKPTRIYAEVDKKTNKKIRVSKTREKLD